MSDQDRTRAVEPVSEDAKRLLMDVEGPGDLTDLSTDELQQLAQEVRELIIDTIGEIGGQTRIVEQLVAQAIEVSGEILCGSLWRPSGQAK